MIALPIAIPLLAAALLAVFGSKVPRPLAHAVALAAGAANAVLSILLLLASRNSPLVYWFGGWKPRGGAAIGVSFVVDPYGAGLAATASILVMVAFFFALRYFDTVGALFHVLMLAFLAALCGFGLTGDLFNLFVWFELMSASAVALCGYKTESRGPLQGALNFGITNTVGAFLVLIGIAILYAKTGALNLAQIGRTLGGMRDGSVIAAFALITCGFLVKAAVVPFHFWLPDAHAVAPTPVCVLFSGIMVEAGLYAVVRCWATMFAPSFAHFVPQLRVVLVALGAITAVLGAVMCFAQRNFKRLLAFSTVSHMGIMLLGFALLAPLGLTASAIYVLGHAGVKGALFVCAGMILHRLRSVDELELAGRGRGLEMIGVITALGAVGLAGVPPFGTFTGEALLEEAARGLGFESIVTPVLIVVAVLTAGAVLRATGRIFLGYAGEDALLADPSDVGGEPSEPPETPTRTKPWLMATTALLLLGGAVLVGLWPALRNLGHAERLLDSAGYAARVLDGKAQATRSVPAPALSGTLRALLSLAGAVLLAAATPLRQRLSLSGLVRGLRALRRVHSGYPGDYVAWLVLGTGGFAALCTLLMR